MINHTPDLAKNSSQVSPTSSSGGESTRSPSSLKNRSYIVALEMKVQCLQEELADAHVVIGRQLHELQYLRRALKEVGIKTERVVVDQNEFNPRVLISPTSVMEEDVSNSLNYSHVSTTKPSPPQEDCHANGIVSNISLPSVDSGTELHPSRIKFQRSVVGSLRRRLSSLSMSEDATNRQTDQGKHTSGPITCDNTANTGTLRPTSHERLSTNESTLPPTSERPCTDVIECWKAKEDIQNHVQDQNHNQDQGPAKTASIEVIRQEPRQCTQDAVDATGDPAILLPSSPHDHEIPRPPSHAESQATTKASNISTFPRPDDVMQRRKNFRAKPSPTLVAIKNARNAYMPDPPERVASPTPTTKSQPPQPESTVKVEGKLLADAWGQEGVYKGSIDPKTSLPHGKGTILYAVSQSSMSPPAAHQYSGQWKQGTYHGFGKLQEAGHTYQGPFENGVRHGSEEAIMTFANGRCFIGRFHADNMREGVLQYEDGSYYEGLLENNRRNGFGFYRFSSGDQYEGQWKDDLMHGRGHMQWTSEGNHYNGEWNNGLQHGVGLDVDCHGNIVHQGHYFEGTPVPKAKPTAQWHVS